MLVIRLILPSSVNLDKYTVLIIAIGINLYKKIINSHDFSRRIPLLNCCTSTWWRKTDQPTCPHPWPPRPAPRPPPHPTTRIPTGCALTRRWCAQSDAAIGNSSSSSSWVCQLLGVVDSGCGLSARASFTGDTECQKNLLQTVIFCWHNFWRRPACFYFIYLPDSVGTSLSCSVIMLSRTGVSQFFKQYRDQCSVGFWPSGFASFYYQAKIVRKTLIPTVN